MLKVLGRITSINVRKVLWAADEMGVGYEREDWGKPNRDPNVPEFLALNPNATVPVVIDDGFVLWESQPVMRYLASKHSSELWPAEVQERARVDQWMSWQSTELNPAWSYPMWALLRKRPGYDDKDKIAQGITEWNAKMQMIETQVGSSSGFVANGRFSLADIVIALSTHRYMMTPFDKPSFPALEAHYRQMQSRPAGKPWLGATTP